MNNFENKKKLSIIEDIILKEKVGASNIARSTTFSSSDIFRLKKTFSIKVKEKSQYEKQVYNSIYISINTENYVNLLEKLDGFISGKQRKSGRVTIKNKEVAPPIKEKASATIKNQNTSQPKIKITELLNRYIFIKDSEKKYIEIFLKDNDEYKSNYPAIKTIKSHIASTGYTFRVKLLGETTTINNMSEKEKQEFMNFLKSF